MVTGVDAAVRSSANDELPAPMHDAGAQLGHGDRTVAEGLAGLLPGVEVRRGPGEVGLVDESAEVDDAVGHRQRRPPRGTRRPRATSRAEEPGHAVLHPVDQVVGGVRPVRGAEDRPLVLDGAGDHLDLVAPRRGEPARGRGRGSGRVPLGEQPGHELATDVAGGAGDEQVHVQPSE